MYNNKTNAALGGSVSKQQITSFWGGGGYKKSNSVLPNGVF